MSDLSTKTALVYDYGAYLSLARSLAKGFGRVYYCSPWQEDYPVINKAVLGDGFGDLLHCPDIWSVKNKVDCFVFPYIYDGPLQIELRDQGFPVWGSAGAERLETNCQYFLNTVQSLGLDVPNYKQVVGVSALREYLKPRSDVFVKVSKFRGSWETVHWRNWNLDSGELDQWAVRFGGVREIIPFICLDKVETTIEIGADTYCIDGQWPDKMLHGVENKNDAYLSSVTSRAEMPDELTPIIDAFSPILKDSRFRSQWSMEVRVGDDKNYFLDATCRGGLPSTPSFSRAKNLSEVIYAGAMGDLVEIDYGFKYSAECRVKVSGRPGCWVSMEVPDEIKGNLFSQNCCEVDGVLQFPPLFGAESQDIDEVREVGWLVATGDTPEEALRKMNDLADALPDGFDACVESLADVIREVDQMKSDGINFSNGKVPPAEVVLAP